MQKSQKGAECAATAGQRFRNHPLPKCLDEAVEVARAGITQAATTTPQVLEELDRAGTLAGYRVWRYGAVINAMLGEFAHQH
jgi:hypothetical protein